MAEYVRCQVKAYEQIPTFVETFNRAIHSDRLEMIQGDFFAADFSFATVIFLYGTLLTQKEIERLAVSIPPKTKVISVSYSLAEYEKTFVVKKSFAGYFPWGETNIYWSEKMGDLAKKKCLPCKGGVSPLAGDELEQYFQQIDEGWKLVEARRLEKSYTFKNFKEALAFVNEVGKVAEEEGHHPDIELGWGKVKLTFWTHKIGGLLEADFVMAAKSDVCFLSHR